MEWIPKLKERQHQEQVQTENAIVRFQYGLAQKE